MTNSSQEKVMDRKKLAKSAGHSIGAVTRSSTCQSRAPRSRAARSIFDLVIAHLAVDDGEAQRHVDHDMADARRRASDFGRPMRIEDDQQAHADDQIADRRAVPR